MRRIPWARLARWARNAALIVGGAFLLYLLIANVILRTGLLRGWLSKDEQKLRVQYDSAWSLYPGHVAVRALSLRYQDRNIQMHLGIDKATLRLDLWGLTHRSLLVKHLEAEGATFRMRHKVETLEGNEGRVSAFPPIEGFADPPVEKAVFEPPLTDESYNLWTIELTDIEATMREVWTMEYRYRGDASVTGGFHLRPQRELWLRPSVMITHGGVLSLGERALIRGGEGRVEAWMDAFDVRVPQGIEVLRQLSGSVHQTGELASLASVEATYFPGRSMGLDRGTGPIEIDTRLDHGVFQPGSRVTYRSDDAIVKAAPVLFEGDLSVVAHVDGPPDHPVLAVDAAMASGGASPIAAPSSSNGRPLDLRNVKASVTLDTADLVAEARIARASAAVATARIADVHAWQALAPENSSFDGGALTLALRASYVPGSLEGRADAVLDDTRMTFDSFKVAASGKVSSNIASADVTKAVAFPGASADLTGISLRLDRGHAEGLWLRARSREPIVTTAPLGADADIAVESGPGNRTVELFSRLAHLPDVAADVTSGTQLRGSLHLRVRPKDVSLAVMDAHNGALEGRGRVRKTPAGLTGAFLVSVGPFNTGLDLHDGDVAVRPLAGGGWLDEKLRHR